MDDCYRLFSQRIFNVGEVIVDLICQPSAHGYQQTNFCDETPGLLQYRWWGRLLILAYSSPVMVIEPAHDEHVVTAKRMWLPRPAMTMTAYLS